MTTKLDRNNTNFSLRLLEHFKHAEWGSEYSFLKYYQNVVREYINDVEIDSRGLLVDHQMGLGKSILAIAVAIDQLRERQPIILLTKSLQGNMSDAIKKYFDLRRTAEPDWPLGRLTGQAYDDWVSANFSFVSMNASNMLKQMGKAAEGNVAEEFDAALEKKFGEVLKLPSLDGKLLIVDEAHNLFRAITNGSKNAIGLYDLVMKSRNLKIVFLTGTPIANDPFELVPCFNMLGSKFGRVILPESYKEFNKLFVGQDGRIKNKEKFQNRILGLVSVVEHKSNPGKGVGVAADIKRAEFPERLPIIVERVNMDLNQYTMYQLARDKEKDEGSGKFGTQGFHEPPSMTKPKSKAASSYRVRSRQISNFSAKVKTVDELTESEIDSAKFRKMYSNIEKHDKQLGVVYSQFVGIGGLGSFARYLDIHGWERVQVGVPLKSTGTISEYEDAGPGEQGELDEYVETGIVEGGFVRGDFTTERAHTWARAHGSADGPSIPPADVFAGIEEEGNNLSTWWIGGDDDGHEHDDKHENDKHDDLSEFGAFDDENDEYVSVLEMLGGEPSRRKYAIISGEVDIDDRTRIKNLFNDPDNKHGGKCDLVLISSTGAEGLDLLRVRHIHAMEPYWNWGRIAQVEARGVRNDSHKDMEPNEKNVQLYIYLAIPPETERLADGSYPSTTDTELYDESVLNQISIESFNDALKAVSIECMVNGESYCRVCNPTNQPLFTDEIARDVRATDPCTQVQEISVKATEIEYEGATYYYTESPDSVYGYRVFKHDSEINGYRQIRESDPVFIGVIAKLIG